MGSAALPPVALRVFARSRNSAPILLGPSVRPTGSTPIHGPMVKDAGKELHYVGNGTVSAAP
jgi:hypothetical protein